MIVTKPYNREVAVEYALKWALSRNPLFYDFTGGGGNCTNFVSQSVLAGALTMNPTDTFGWYYTNLNDRSPSWTGVREFYEFMCGIGDFAPIRNRVGPFCEEVSREKMEIGDVVQLANSRGQFYHSLLVTGFRDGDILISAQSNDALNRPLSTYNYTTARFLHVVGVNVELADDIRAFLELLNAVAIPPKNQIYVPQTL